MTKLPEKELLCPSEVAEYFTVTVKTVYRWIEKGALISVKVGGVVRITRKSILDSQK